MHKDEQLNSHSNNTTSESSPVSDEQSLGQLFQKTRNSLNLSLEDVNRRTQIRPVILKALEDDQFEIEGIPSTFIRGYIRSYAACLGIPEDKYIDYLSQLPEEPVSDLQKHHSINGVVGLRENAHGGRWISIITAIVIIAVLFVTALWWWESYKQKSDSRAQLVSQYDAQQATKKIESHLLSLPTASLPSNTIDSKDAISSSN
ncbi:hypothetical protein A6A19_01980 [Actinobacillus delphinicola]|uniref:helix-turn-helix domain-containing protein n=1 Tax=Actinobacillus delphinicola TaxID=51161 RepID=UPI00244343C7|nr:helix-turn-helix domain-containing protein [Actinobacillus delphinicola]MDG6896796.1 hypothetical protein [Actinobacillus delphinicola]